MYDNLLCHDIKRDMSNEGVVANKSGGAGGAGEEGGCWGGTGVPGRRGGGK